MISDLRLQVVDMELVFFVMRDSSYSPPHVKLYDLCAHAWQKTEDIWLVSVILCRLRGGGRVYLVLGAKQDEINSGTRAVGLGDKFVLRFLEKARDRSLLLGITESLSSAFMPQHSNGE